MQSGPPSPGGRRLRGVLHDSIFPMPPVGFGTMRNKEDSLPPDEGAGLLWRALEVLQSASRGARIDQDTAWDIYHRLASGEYHITSVRPAAYVAEQLGAAGHASEVGAGIAELLGVRQPYQLQLTTDTPPASSSNCGPPSPNLCDSLDNADVYIESASESEPEEPLPVLPLMLVPEVDRVLRTATGWQFNAFKLAESTNHAPLSTLCFWVLQTLGLIREFDLDTRRLTRFLLAIESGYSTQAEVLYHSRTHAADVLQSMFVLMHQGGLDKHLGTGQSKQLAVLAAYLAATVHDYQHVGLSNDFLIRTGHKLALEYNDLSPNENNHVASAWALLTQPEMNFIYRMSRKNQARLRTIMIDMVLATDMKQHVQLHTALQTRLTVVQANERAPELRRSNGSLSESHSGHGRTSSLEHHNLDARHRIRSLETVSTSPLDESELVLLLQIGLKCADIGHLSADWSVHRQWVERLEEEMFRQGDKERGLHLTLSALSDRHGKGVTDMQPGFFDFVALPLLSTWVAVCPGAAPMIDAAKANREGWAALDAKKAAARAARAAAAAPALQDDSSTEPAKAPPAAPAGPAPELTSILEAHGQQQSKDPAPEAGSTPNKTPTVRVTAGLDALE